jgi:hypothetical protein
MGFRCPKCGTLYFKLDVEKPCRTCHASFINPDDTEFGFGDRAKQLWQNCGLTRAFRN